MSSKVKTVLRNLLPRRIKPHRILAGPLRGRTMVTSWHHNFTSLTGKTEPDLVAWLQRNAEPGETWLDIGGNYGYTAMILADRVGPTGRVFAFEPKLETCGCLSETAQVNRLEQITVVPLALGTCETIEQRRFGVSGSMVVQAMAAQGATETIMVANLDWLWPRISSTSQRIHGVKIDVQGMELEVLRGMIGLLAAYSPKLVIELHAGVDRSALLDLLQQCGYERKCAPVFPAFDEDESGCRDNMSYAFRKLQSSVVV
jgi:FkbM family methyltransferase